MRLNYSTATSACQCFTPGSRELFDYLGLLRRIRPQAGGASALLGRCGLLQFAELASEVVGVLEALVHRCKPEVGDLIEAPELLEHGYADRRGDDLGTRFAELFLDAGGQHRNDWCR